MDEVGDNLKRAVLSKKSWNELNSVGAFAQTICVEQGTLSTVSSGAKSPPMHFDQSELT